MSDASPLPAGRISPTNLALGFVAGFLAVLVFHQGMLAFLYAIDFASNGPFQMKQTGPFNVPRFVSLAFWGGVWGVVYVLVETRFPHGAKYWLCALVFGALAPSLLSWFVIAPIRGNPIAGGWEMANIIRGLLLNGAWGLGTGATLWLLRRVLPPRP